ncbi:hypothetical protein GW764_01345 [Candidatus Parcubacteria bacterium]|nr:hypothetical protein [Candidatus Parcubacteria bacterium]
MQISLTIYPVIGNFNLPEVIETMNGIIGFNRLRFQSDRRIFRQIIDLSEYEKEKFEQKVSPKPLPAGISLTTYEDEGLTEVKKDDLFGNELCYLEAGDFMKIIFPEDTSQINMAIKSFLDSLDPKTMIILYWEG